MSAEALSTDPAPIRQERGFRVICWVVGKGAFSNVESAEGAWASIQPSFVSMCPSPLFGQLTCNEDGKAGGPGSSPPDDALGSWHVFLGGHALQLRLCRPGR